MLRYLGAMRRFPRTLDPARVDAATGLAIAVGMELEIWLGPAAGRPGALAAPVVGAAIAVRRRRPLTALAAALVATLAADAFSGSATPGSLTGIVAAILLTYAAGAQASARRATAGLVMALAGLGLATLLTGGGSANAFFAVVVLGLLPWATGWALRRRDEGEQAQRAAAERLDGERELRARMAAQAERARIARELHDVIAHSVSVMVIQAAGARAVMDREPRRAEASLQLVERAGRDALAEMQRLLGVLNPGAPQRSLAPPPRLADLDELLRRTRLAGLAADLEVEGHATPIPPALDLCAYRIVQEALTNAIKHAGAGQAVVRLRWRPDRLELEVRDDGRGPAAVTAGGHGIAGMRERAALHGGVVRAGAGDSGGFAVQASLPLAREHVA